MIKYFVTLLFVCSYTVALSQRYAFISYNTREGLPQSQVNAIVQGEDGYLWLGTLGGLAKFDGNNFTTYGKSDGLLNNRITHLEVIDSKIFIGHDKGISYQCAVDSFCAVTLPAVNSSGNVTDIKFFKKEIYVATNGSGLFCLNRDLNKLTHIKDSPSRIRSLSNNDEKLFLATRNGVFSFDGSAYKNLGVFPDESFSSITVDKNHLTATTYEGVLYSYSFLLKNGEVDIIFKDESNPLRKAITDASGNLWLNSKKGAILLKESDTIHFTERTGLPINDINIIFEDREKNIWFGTGGKGLLKFTGEVFTHFNEKSNLPSDLIISLLEDKYGKMWLSTFDKGICTLDEEGNVHSEKYVPSIVWSMAKTDNLLLFGSNFGLHVYDYTEWKSYYVEDGLPSNRIRGLKTLKNGDVIIGTGDGTAVFNSKNEKIDSIGSKISLVSNVRDFIELEDKMFLAGQNGVFKFDDDQLSLLHQFEAGVNCIETDDSNSLWIGTENGLFIEQNDTLINYTLEENGGADYINFIEKVDSVMFIGTNNGLYEISFDTKSSIHYDFNAGLVDLETNLNSSYLDSDNHLWFGTVAGLMKMKLTERMNLIKHIPPKIHLTEVFVNFNRLNKITTEKMSDFPSADLKIDYKNNNISFEFDGIYLTNPKGLMYSYFLEGFSENWSPPSPNPSTSFTNLSPGHYALLFKATNAQGVNSEIFRTSFEVNPPFYGTWWFYLFCFTMLAIAILFLDRMRVKRLERKNYRLKLEFQNKLTRLEQQSLNASMNRHFIFNSLNSIQYYINSSDKISANKYLSRFAKLIRKNLDSSYQENGMVALSDELERLELYLELECMRFKDKFDYEIQVGNKVEVELLKVPAMFLQPFVENSIIHGVLPLKDRKGLIEVIITDHFDHIRIEIKDNGVGIENSVKNKTQSIKDHESHGMLITKGRIELLQKISARSIEMIGPIQISENDSLINGTLVTFKILKQYLE